MLLLKFLLNLQQSKVMAKMLIPLLRKLPPLSSMKMNLLFRCKCENTVESYTTENGRCFNKECKPVRISDVEKDCSFVSVQNMSATSSTSGNNCEPIIDDKGCVAPGTASDAVDVLQYPQCYGTPLMASEDEPTKRINPPEVPTNCCMTGCPNCVWLQFAKDMMEFSIEGGPNARKIIEEIEDPNLRTFLLFELDTMQKI